MIVAISGRVETDSQFREPINDWNCCVRRIWSSGEYLAGEWENLVSDPKQKGLRKGMIFGLSR